MTVTTEAAERLMKRCQIGVGGRNALDDAHDIMASCYGTIGALVQERDRLKVKVEVMRGLLRDADEVIGILTEDDRHEDQIIRALRTRIAAAIYRDVCGSEWAKVS